MKKYFIIGFIVIGLVIGAYLSYGQLGLAGGRISTNATYYAEGSSATTSVVYLYNTTTGAAVDSSVVVPTEDIEKFSIDTQFNASTTASVFTMKLYVSQNNNCDTAPTACDWFSLPNVTTDSGIANTVGSTTATYTFTPQTAGINRFSILINPSDHKWFKITRSQSSGTASSTVWQQVALTRGY